MQHIAALALLALSFSSLLTSSASAQIGPRPEDHECKVDLTEPGMMKDILSNALMRGLERPEEKVASFLVRAESRFSTGDAMLKAATKPFAVSESLLRKTVEEYRHCNCKAHVDLSDFARDVTLHVALHELGHALVREFDLPILGNEETLADAFATHFLVHHLPDRALPVLKARVQSLQLEAGEVPREEWTVQGEHNSDARRAYQIAALALAFDAKKFASLAAEVGMPSDKVEKAVDYGAEIHRSWRRILRPLFMPAGTASKEVRLWFDSDDGLVAQIEKSSLNEELRTILSRFDWHSQVSIRFPANGRGAGWSRSKRTVTISREYVARFVRQGQRLRER